MKKAVVALSRIRLRDRRFSFSNDIDPAPLADSIRRQGLLTPPLLFGERGRLSVVSGRRRLQALRLLGERTVAARVLSEEFVSPFEAWSMNYEETVMVRPLDAAEGCRAVTQLAALGMERGEIVSCYLSRLGLPPKEETYDQCLGVASCGETLLGRLAEGRLTLTTAAYLSSLTAPDRRSALGYLARAPLTVSQQREWVRLVADIVRRDGIRLPALLAAAARRSPGGAGKGGGMMQYLRERRYPALAERKKAFAALLRRLSPPRGLSIEPHPSFERDEVRVSFTVRDGESLDRVTRMLERLRKDPALASLFGGKGKDGR